MNWLKFLLPYIYKYSRDNGEVEKNNLKSNWLVVSLLVGPALESDSSAAR